MTQIHKDHFSNPLTQSTEMRIEQYYGKKALLQEWEEQPEDVVVRNHHYLLGLRQRIRQVDGYIKHRRDPTVDFHQKRY